MNKALVVLSGGQDSTTCLFWALEVFNEVSAITFDYGQRHRAELRAAVAVFKDAQGSPNGFKLQSHKIVALGEGLFPGTSPLTNKDYEVENYKDAKSLPGGLEKTYVPLRNMVFITVAAAYAYVDGASNIVLGVSQEDFGGYPDCREEFIKAATLAVRAGLPKDGRMFTINTPLINMSKMDTVLLAASMGGCMSALAYSHTCYEGTVPPCGKCHSCLLRQKGFDDAGIPDPLMTRFAQ